MIETHPFGIFMPPKARYLLLGSFTGKLIDDSYDWFYTNGRNQFWPILEQVYNLELRDKKIKQELFSKLNMGIGDIIYQCERRYGTNLDNNLINITYNIKPIKIALQNNQIRKIFFTSRFVEIKYKKVFKDVVQSSAKIDLITLPSPSPRYAQMSKEEKIKRYTKLLPKLI